MEKLYLLLILSSLFGHTSFAQSKSISVEPNPTATEDIRLVSDYLSSLTSGNIEVTAILLAPSFYQFSPSDGSPSNAEVILQNWKEMHTRYKNQQFVWAQTASVRVTDFLHRGTWVYHSGYWQAYDKQTGEKVNQPVQQLTKLKDGKIAVVRLSVGEDEIALDIKLPLVQELQNAAQGPLGANGIK